jgi:hypothetical protein
MERRGDEVHIETDEARGGSTPNIVRWVLGVSLLAAIVLLSIIWMTGAATQGPAESEVNVTSPAAGDAGGGTVTTADESADDIPGVAD